MNSFSKAVTSSGVGGSPMRSKLARRMNVRASAGGFIVSPFSFSFSVMKASMELCLVDFSGWKAQCVTSPFGFSFSTISCGHAAPSVDPAFDEIRFSRRERGLLLRHLGFLAGRLWHDHRVKRRLRRLAGNDGRPFIAAFQRRFERLHVQPAFGRHVVVALDAVFHQDRGHLLMKQLRGIGFDGKSRGASRSELREKVPSSLDGGGGLRPLTQPLPGGTLRMRLIRGGERGFFEGSSNVISLSPT
jgi:hypothetical protein